MDDDFNTREALRALLDLVTAVNRHLDDHDAYDYRGLHAAIETFEELAGGVMGLGLGDGTDGADEEAVRIADGLIEYVLELREAQRDAGNYENADELRDVLEAMGVTVEDTDEGTAYRY
jgi:cysteinyl-tRNA synthetase